MSTDVMNSVNDESSKAGDEPSIHIVVFPNDGAQSTAYIESDVCLMSSEGDDDCSICSVSETSTENSVESSASTVNDDCSICPVGETSTEVSMESSISTLKDDCSICSVGETNTEASEESSTSIDNGMSMEQLLSMQTEKTRMSLVDAAEDMDLDETDRCFASIAAEIVEWWQRLVGDENPTSYTVDFGADSPINLLMILALLPERYQGLVCIEDAHRSPSHNGENLSWLHEQTIDTLVQLSIDPSPTSMFFGQGLASMIRYDVDEGWRAFTGRSWLEDQIHLCSTGNLEPDLYRFPPETEKIVFLFNPSEIHWTVVEIDLDDYVWTYTLYNSLFKGEKGATWRACQEQFPLLEQLICRASGFAEPVTREIVTGDSVQQENTYDCGPIALYNAIELLDGRTPRTDIDPEALRLRYLKLILTALYLSDEGLEPTALKFYMRKVCLDYPL